jgi:hypothetical protein
MTHDGEEKEQVGVVSVYEIEKKKIGANRLSII